MNARPVDTLPAPRQTIRPLARRALAREADDTYSDDDDDEIVVYACTTQEDHSLSRYNHLTLTPEKIENPQTSVEDNFRVRPGQFLLVEWR